MKDLVVLVADKNIEYVVKGLLSRPPALGISPVSYDSFVHPRRDPGCLNEAHDFLRPLASAYEHALVMFDHEGCGQEHEGAEALAREVKGRLCRNGWPGRADAVILVPELEQWVWTPSPHVEDCLGWAGRIPRLREWLVAEGHWDIGSPKPDDPKGAVQAALREVRKPRSSAIYLELAQTVSLQGHAEPAYARLIRALREWFPQ